ncbi:MAG: hypothetical protein E4G98_01355 [Promethearchaeota archaeon]|nr:MAG: hypothetical protein E4G98_01355 [Candidatus Lokiarchaeota archaeon]
MSLFDELQREKKFSGSLIQKFQQEYGDLFFRSLAFLQNEGTKIKKTTFKPSNLEIWTIEGTSGTYLVYPGIYCQCHNFVIDIIYRKQKFSYCKHLLSLKLAMCVEQYQDEEKKDSEYLDWMKKLHK